MGENRTSISKATSYEEIAEFWESQDVTKYWDDSKVVEIELDIQSETKFVCFRTHIGYQSEESRPP